MPSLRSRLARRSSLAVGDGVRAAWARRFLILYGFWASEPVEVSPSAPSPALPLVEDSLVSPIVACVCGLGCGITSGVLCTEWHCGVRCGAGALSATSGLEVAGMRVYKRAVTGCKWCVSQPVTWGEGGRSLGLSVSRCSRCSRWIGDLVTRVRRVNAFVCGLGTSPGYVQVAQCAILSGVGPSAGAKTGAWERTRAVGVAL